MNCDGQQCSNRGLWVYVLAGLGTFLIMGLLVWAMVHYTSPAPVGAARAEERRKNLVEVKAAEADAMKGYVWENQEKGFVRVPVDVAMRLVVQEWKEPEKARAQMIDRVEKATEVPPPPPEKPSPFE